MKARFRLHRQYGHGSWSVLAVGNINSDATGLDIKPGF